VRVAEGRIVAITPGPFITLANYSFALRASRDAWEKLWSPKPLPGFHRHLRTGEEEAAAHPRATCIPSCPNLAVLSKGVPCPACAAREAAA